MDGDYLEMSWWNAKKFAGNQNQSYPFSYETIITEFFLQLQVTFFFTQIWFLVDLGV